LVPPQQAQGRRVTIDLFFRTLAQAYGQRAVAVILSGTDSDGVIGLKHVRAQGGVTIAQDPTEAEYDSMPVTAISTGMVDWVLPVGKMAPKLMEFVQNENRITIPPEVPEAEEPDTKDADAPGGETVSEETLEPDHEKAIGEVLKHLRGHTGHDFAHYKRATVLRRLARRLQVNSLENIPEYLRFLHQHPAESQALLQDLLIGVTHFFRDRAAFAALEAHIPQLFAGKKKEDQIRIWVAGCATGEEAYSLAMLLCEYAERLPNPPSIHIFASDVDEHAIQDARDGTYPATIEADVSQERLRRFFRQDHGRYRVRKDLREKVLFAAHNILRDPPFSRMDMVSCRNLLIYLTASAQEQIFDIFHFTLRAGGLLFVGGAESSQNVESLFSPVDARHRIYVRRSIPRPAWRIPILPGPPPYRARPLSARTRMLPPLTSAEAQDAKSDAPDALRTRQERRATLFGELHLKMLEDYGPPSVVVNENHNIVHLSEHGGRYLQLGAGEPTANIMTMVHPALRLELRTALFRAAQDRIPFSTAPQTVEIDDHTSEEVTIQVRPVKSNEGTHGFFLVLFEKTEKPASAPSAAPPTDVARELDDEIQYLKEQLSATVEQYEAANEELKASNEELQASNEEMRSATEELETSKEELQSVNEELSTVNHELKSSVEELSRTNSDLNNLMASTDIGTIFLDRQLRIQRFTSSAQQIFNLIPADLGRPLSDITHRLVYAELMQDAEQVLDNLSVVEREVQRGEGSWNLVRIAPYRTQEDRIAGVVATFIDITQRRLAEQELRAMADQMAAQLEQFNSVMSSVPDFIYQFDLEGRFTYVSQSLLKLWQKPAEEALGKNFFELNYPPELAARLQAQIAQVIETRQQLKDETPFTSATGERLYEYIFFPLLAEDGRVEGVGGVTRDVTERQEAGEALRESEERFRQFAENASDVFWILDAKTMRFEYLNPIYEKMFGQPIEVLMANKDGRLDLVLPEDRAQAATGLHEALAGKSYVRKYRILRPTDGQVRWIRGIGFPITDETGTITRVAGMAQDVTEEEIHAEELRVSDERFQLLVEGAPDHAMVLLDQDATITFWSAGAEKVFGWSAEEAVGQRGELFFTPEDRAAGQAEKEMTIAMNKGVALDRRWHLRKNGKRVWIDGVMRRLDHPDGTLRGFAKIARDASDLHDAEEEVLQARDQMEKRVVERTRELVAANKELTGTIAQRQELERELLEISEREKRRIGEDLHDMVCQELTATALFLKSTAKRVAAESLTAAETLEDAAQIVNRNVGLTRDLARGLQPADLKGAGLKEALRGLCAQAGENGEIKCHLKAAKGVRVTDDTIALHLYRVAQEAVTNAVKHSGAKNLLIVLDKNTENVCVTVEDDGKGFSPSRRSKGLGLHIMRYRANVLGGKLKIQKRKRGGTEITCVIPNKR
ncbi:MAG: PAS domain S-box protein, partial [Chthoniobacterales bacterium]